MITKVVLAKLSPTMEEGTVVKWNKKEGDAVKVGDVLAEIETDKANMEMEALGDGVLRRILVQAGGKAPVGALIGVIAAPDEDISAMLAEAPGDASTPSTARPPSATPTTATPTTATTTAQADLPAKGAPPTPAPPAPAASPAPAPAPAAGREDGRIKSSPLARAMAAQRSVPLAAVAGSGPGGRIVKRDIEGYLAAPPPAAPAAAEARKARSRIPVPSVPPGTAIPLTSMRRTIAKRLGESKFTAPHFYVTVEIDMDAAVALREEILQAEEVKVSYNDLVVKACAKALTRFPVVNATWTGEAIQTHAEVHVGVAVSLPEGLITPIVRDADRKSVVTISAEIKDLAARAREKRLKPEEFAGSTFTVSNLGMFDVTEFTAIINPPESAILAVGAVRKQPVVVDDELTIGHRMKVTLSSDHRVVDGALAAQFLAEVRRLLESPISLLV
ncbi:MAG TPA: pyruvate dehydrogenase complex dihydrolipoamide acetyltransferase [Vicinamibacteria bacterium]|nr:pyruvate dehydrogenase complex dihydrolipoamide acetyltransferase [Vicinamibacteria bacterium]